MGHLNSFSASGVGNLNKNFPKIQMPGGLPGGGMFKLRFDWYIIEPSIDHISPQYAFGGRKTVNIMNLLSLSSRLII